MPHAGQTERTTPTNTQPLCSAAWFSDALALEWANDVCPSRANGWPAHGGPRELMTRGEAGQSLVYQS